MTIDLHRLQSEVEEVHPDATVCEVLSAGVGGVVVLLQIDGHQRVLKRLRNRSKRRKQADREVTMLRAAQGPHVVRLLDVHRTEQYQYLTMEHLEQPSLRDRLHHRWTAADLVASACSIASALARLHRQRILFNDLKPRNVGVTGTTSLSAKLLDFGHARTVGDTRAQAFVGGSLDYLAPEFVRQGQPGPTSDVWSWARSWHLLAAGSYFGRFANANQLFLSGPRMLPPVQQVSRVPLPESFAELIDGSLAADQTLRPDDGCELEERIAHIIAAEWGEPHLMPTRFSIHVD